MSEPDFMGTIGTTKDDSEPAWGHQKVPAAGSPNVVLIVLDDVGFGQLGCYGSSIRTPSLDALAAQGLRYTNFHTAALCSPTRASLLTGRNHHSVGMGFLADGDHGFPGYRGEVSHSAATMAEILGAVGYDTIATGKWHLAPPDQQSPAGRFNQWPLQRGFDHYYGFLDAMTSQWTPELTRDNGRIETPTRAGYHLSEDLVDNAIDRLREQVSWAPDNPFFLYLAFGACHEPHHAPAAYIDSYRGMFDDGWDVCRERWFVRQKELGIVPADTELPPRNPGVPSWDDLAADEKRLAVRLQEAFAGMLEHVDAQIGRLTGFLDGIGKRDNTLIFVVSDNGASQEGGRSGAVNTSRCFNGIESLDRELADLELVGSAFASNNYPTGWAMAGNVPGRWYKQNNHAGGIREPLIVSWPMGIPKPGGIRSQFHHAIDVLPTVLDVLGIQAPESYRGVPQMPIHGVSMRYTFARPSDSSARRVQYFEMLGHRGIYRDGWKAVTHHGRGCSFDDDSWELYNLSQDFSESNDLSGSHPELLASMVEQWWEEARRYDVLPLDDRLTDRNGGATVPQTIRTRHRHRIYRGVAHLGPGVAPSLNNVSHSISVELDRSDGGDGVLIAHGGRGGGYSLYVKDGLLTYLYNSAGRHYRVVAHPKLPEARTVVRMDFVSTGRRQGRVELRVDGQLRGTGAVHAILPMFLSIEGFDIGADRLTPVSDDYVSPFEFTGSFDYVDLEVRDDLGSAGGGGAALAWQ